ncbi:MAG: branched-chain amino acid ABC transporter substrate-binding protein, partial [Halomonas sp.]
MLSNVFPEPEDSGLRGAELAIEDNLTSGQFLGHDYPLTNYVADEEADLLDAFEEMQEQDIDLFVANVPASALIAMADRLDEGQMLFNAGARDDHLRGSQCHPQVLHTQPSYAMLTDALVHAIEAFVSTGSGPLTDAHAL